MSKDTMILDFSKDYYLTNGDVSLIPLSEDHIEPLSVISNDKEIWKYFFEKANDPESLKRYVQSAIENRKATKEYTFVVFDKQRNQYAGTTRFYEYSSVLKTIKLGHTWYGKAFRGTSLNKHCKYLLFEFTFEKMGMERIGFGAYAGNSVSIAAMKSVGCKKEGVLRNIFPSIDSEGRTDAILMSNLRHEWYQKVKFELANKL